MQSATVGGTPADAAGTLTLGGELTVRRMGFGTLRVMHAGPEGARALLRRAVDLGVNLIDTADVYGPELSEQYIGEALYPYPEDLVIATKGGQVHVHGKPCPDCSPDHLRKAFEGSLRRLRLETIDLYQLHNPDPEVPLEECLGTLAELRSQGKVRNVGVCNFSLDQLALAREIVPVVSVQNRYSMSTRDYEPVLQACEREGIAFMPWFPLDGGPLATGDGPLDRFAADRGVTSAQVALAWLLQRSSVMLPIPGTSSMGHLEENVDAAALWLSEADKEELAKAGVPT
jgi:pyridoxine 4-dehydrogenase